jgi:hypothetical protein
MAEAATLAERYEIDPAKLMEVITETLFAAPAYATYSKLIIQREFIPGRFLIGSSSPIATAGRRRSRILNRSPSDCFSNSDATSRYPHSPCLASVIALS